MIAATARPVKVIPSRRRCNAVQIPPTIHLSQLVSATTVVLVALLAVACASGPSGGGGVPTRPSLAGLDPCDDHGCLSTPLDPARPVVVLVHGCNSSTGRFATLREVFAAHGQQAVCFAYDDRATLAASADQLRSALARLTAQFPGQPVTVLGHSQGGLVARLALTAGTAPLAPEHRLRLVTISTPFNGIASSSHCGIRAVQVATLGLSAALCHAITGAKWFEIHPRALEVVAPAPLATAVSEHLMIVTDETGACRTSAADGHCLTNDFVFSVAEQLNPRLATDPRQTAVTVVAGHAAIVGDDRRPPHQLRRLLEEHRVLDPLPPERADQVEAVVARLYQTGDAPATTAQ